MVQRTVISIAIGFVLLIPTHSFGQSNFWKKLDLDLSYSSVDTWRRALSDDPIVIKDDDGKAFGAAVNFHLNKKVFFQFKYQRTDLYNVDLEASFNQGSWGILAGRKFSLSDKLSLNLKTGLNAIRYPLYVSTITRGYVNGQLVDEGPIVRSLTGTGSFMHWTVGGELLYDLTPELDLGVGGDLNIRSISHGAGFTLTFAFIRVDIF